MSIHLRCEDSSLLHWAGILFSVFHRQKNKGTALPKEVETLVGKNPPAEALEQRKLKIKNEVSIEMYECLGRINI